MRLRTAILASIIGLAGIFGMPASSLAAVLPGSASAVAAETVKTASADSAKVASTAPADALFRQKPHIGTIGQNQPETPHPYHLLAADSQQVALRKSLYDASGYTVAPGSTATQPELISQDSIGRWIGHKDQAGRQIGSIKTGIKGPTNAADPFHHVFPQRADLAAEFNARGIDPNQFTIQLPRDLHIDIHRGGPRGGKWNQHWEDFFNANPNATDIDIYREAGRMFHNFELPGGQIVPYPK